jgi:predicted metal-dependent phosphoesterase TrpH
MGMLIDLHVHSSRYSSCGRSSAEAMVERAAEVGLDALVFTEHNVVWPRVELATLQASYPLVRLYAGTELTSSDGDDYLVYGLTDPAAVRANMEAADIIRTARRQGAAVVLAHPYRYRDAVPAEINLYPVDAIEIMSTNIYNFSHAQAVSLARQLDAVTTAASDGHHADMLGLYAMEIDSLPVDECALADVIRSKQMRIVVDIARIAQQNDVIASQIPCIQAYIVQGLENQDLRERLTSYANLTVIQGVREGRDVLRPLQVPIPLSVRAES